MTDPLPAVFVGLDVGKSDHHAVALTAAGKTVLDKALPNDEAKLRAMADSGFHLIDDLDRIAGAVGKVL